MITGKEMDERRYLMFDAADELIAISFLGVSVGVDLADVPGIEGPALSQVLEEQGIKLLV